MGKRRKNFKKKRKEGRSMCPKPSLLTNPSTPSPARKGRKKGTKEKKGKRGDS